MNVKRWTAECCERHHRHVEVVSASDYDALLAERDALKEAGEGLVKYASAAIGAEFQLAQEFNCEPEDDAATSKYIAEIEAALAAWRAATGEG